MAALVHDLGLAQFEQFSQGTLVFEERGGEIRRGLTFSTMAGALRVDGGLAKVVDALAASLCAANLRLSTEVRRIRRTPAGIEIELSGGEVACRARNVVVAVPPRVAAHHLSFVPELTPAQSEALSGIPTWMAGHAKFIAVYDRPFWRTAGQSGDAISHRGPLVEIHDASPQGGEEGALFGFLGTPAQARAARGSCLEADAVEQLSALFGVEAGTPKATLLVDWAQERLTAVAADFVTLGGPPDFGLPAALSDVWNGHLRFASSETAATSGGLLEGALERAAQVLADERFTSS